MPCSLFWIYLDLSSGNDILQTRKSRLLNICLRKSYIFAKPPEMFPLTFLIIIKRYPKNIKKTHPSIEKSYPDTTRFYKGHTFIIRVILKGVVFIRAWSELVFPHLHYRVRVCYGQMVVLDYQCERGDRPEYEQK